MLTGSVTNAVEVAAVEDDTLQAHPPVAEADLGPGVDDAARGEPVQRGDHDAVLKSFVDGRTVQSAADPTGSQQRHQQGGFGIALAVPSASTAEAARSSEAL